MASAEAWKLHVLLCHACSGRHVLIFEQNSPILNWLDQIDDQTKSAYTNAINLSTRSAATLTENTSTVHIDPTKASVWGDPESTLGMDDALKLLAEPLGILVENSKNDWHFLHGIMRQSEKDRIDHAMDNGWIDVLHGGGDNLKTEIERRAQKPHTQVRTFAIFDSDRRHPDELNPAWVPAGNQQCTGLDFQRLAQTHIPNRYWMLKRRFIESYLPRKWIEIAINGNINANAVPAYFRMNRQAQWHYNMKRGFLADNNPENHGRAKDLYLGVPEDDLAALSGGFGRKLADQYENATEFQFDWDAEAKIEASQNIPSLIRLI